MGAQIKTFLGKRPLGTKTKVILANFTWEDTKEMFKCIYAVSLKELSWNKKRIGKDFCFD